MLVSRQIIRRRKPVDRAGRRLVRNTLGEEISSAEFIETREPRLHIKGLLFQRLENDLVADLADPHLGALEAEFFGQAHGLAAAMHEQLGGCTHDPPPPRYW